jgi:hypothetical protein
MRQLPSREKMTKPTLGQIVAFYKYQSTKQINLSRGAPGVKFWQRNYYESIIRNQRDFEARRKYIEDNPMQWALDSDNPNNLKS